MLELKIKNGVYGYNQNDWFVCKIFNKWYLLSRSEYKDNENELGLFVYKYMTRGFSSKKALIDFYKNQAMYRTIFES